MDQTATTASDDFVICRRSQSRWFEASQIAGPTPKCIRTSLRKVKVKVEALSLFSTDRDISRLLYNHILGIFSNKTATLHNTR